MFWGLFIVVPEEALWDYPIIQPGAALLCDDDGGGPPKALVRLWHDADEWRLTDQHAITTRLQMLVGRINQSSPVSALEMPRAELQRRFRLVGRYTIRPPTHWEIFDPAPLYRWASQYRPSISQRPGLPTHH
jgi:hypothetical protein